jgi:hypothetical protein
LRQAEPDPEGNTARLPHQVGAVPPKAPLMPHTTTLSGLIQCCIISFIILLRLRTLAG